MNPDFVRVDLRNSIWEIPNRYENLQILGSGAYGLVCSSFDRSRQIHVAIKKISNPFQTPIHAKRTYREMKLLKHMKHDNVSNCVVACFTLYWLTHAILPPFRSSDYWTCLLLLPHWKSLLRFIWLTSWWVRTWIKSSKVKNWAMTTFGS